MLDALWTKQESNINMGFQAKARFKFNVLEVEELIIKLLLPCMHFHT